MLAILALRNTSKSYLSGQEPPPSTGAHTAGLSGENGKQESKEAAQRWTPHERPVFANINTGVSIPGKGSASVVRNDSWSSHDSSRHVTTESVGSHSGGKEHNKSNGVAQPWPPVYPHVNPLAPAKQGDDSIPMVTNDSQTTQDTSRHVSMEAVGSHSGRMDAVIRHPHPGPVAHNVSVPTTDSRRIVTMDTAAPNGGTVPSAVPSTTSAHPKQHAPVTDNGAPDRLEHARLLASLAHVSTEALSKMQSQETSSMDVDKPVKTPKQIPKKNKQASRAQAGGEPSVEGTEPSPKKADRQYVEDPEVRKYDVYTGRGGKGNNNDGNKRLRKVVSLTRSTYKKLEDKRTKTDFSLFIVDYILNMGGRFLKKDEGKRYYIMSRKEARRNVVQALRETKTYEWIHVDIDEKLLFTQLVAWKAKYMVDNENHTHN